MMTKCLPLLLLLMGVGLALSINRAEPTPANAAVAGAMLPKAAYTAR
jgi:hypothetical protein